MATKRQFQKTIKPITPIVDINPPIEEEISGSYDEIKIDKVIYSNGSVNKVIDRSFSELISEDPTIDVEGFFKEYNQLFYDIPKSGSKESHLTLIEQSTDYLQGFDDPKDARIESLLNRIEELELQLSESEETLELSRIPENPNFPNGSFVAGSAGIYVMDRGYKRPLGGVEVWETFKSIRKQKSVNDEDIFVRPGQGVLNKIPEGPLFTETSFTEGEKEMDEFLAPIKYQKELAEKIKKLDPDGISVKKPQDYQTDQEYIDALNKDIVELEKVIQLLEEDPFGKNQNSINFNTSILKILKELYELALEGGRDKVIASLNNPSSLESAPEVNINPITLL